MKFKKIVAGVLLATMSSSVMARDILVYKHMDFGEWKAGASDVNSAIDTFGDPENPTSPEKTLLINAQTPNDGHSIVVGEISPGAQNVSPGDILTLSIPINEGDNTDAIKTQWSAGGGNLGATVTSGGSPTAVWTAPAVAGPVSIAAVVSEVNTGSELKTVTYNVVGAAPTMPSFTISDTVVPTGGTVTAMGNEDATDPDSSGTLTYKFLLKDTSGNLIAESAAQNYVIDPVSLGLNGGNYSVYYQVSDGDFQTTTLPKNFSYGDVGAEDTWMLFINDAFGTSFSSWDEVNVPNMDFSSLDYSSLTPPSVNLPDLSDVYDNNITVTLPNNASLASKIVILQDNLKTLDFGEVTEDTSGMIINDLRVSNLSFSGNGTISESEMIRLIGELRYSSVASFYFKDTNQANPTLVAINNRSDISEIDTIEVQGGDLSTLSSKNVTGRLAVFDKSVTVADAAALGGHIQINDDGGVDGLYIDYSSTGDLSGMDLRKFEYLAPTRFNVRNSAVLDNKATAGSPLCNAILNGDTEVNPGGSVLYLNGYSSVCESDSTQEWVDWWNAEFSTSFTNWSDFSPSVQTFGSISIGDLPDGSMSDVLDNMDDSFAPMGAASVEMANKLMSGQNFVSTIDLSNVSSGDVSTLFDVSGVSTQYVILDGNGYFTQSEVDGLMGDLVFSTTPNVNLSSTNVSVNGLNSLGANYPIVGSLETDFTNFSMDDLKAFTNITSLTLKSNSMPLDKISPFGVAGVNVTNIEVDIAGANLANIDMWAPDTLKVNPAKVIANKAGYSSALCLSIFSGDTVLEPGYVTDASAICESMPAEDAWVFFFNNQCGHGFADWDAVLAANEINCSSKAITPSDLPDSAMPDLDSDTSLNMADNAMMTDISFLSGLRSVKDLNVSGIEVTDVTSLTGLMTATSINVDFSAVTSKIPGNAPVCSDIGFGTVDVYDNGALAAAEVGKSKMCNPYGSTNEVAWMNFFNAYCGEHYTLWSDAVFDPMINCSGEGLVDSNVPAESMPALGLSTRLNISDNAGLSSVSAKLGAHTAGVGQYSIYNTSESDLSVLEGMSRIGQFDIDSGAISVKAAGDSAICGSIYSGNSSVYDYNTGSSVYLAPMDAFNAVCDGSALVGLVDGENYEMTEDPSNIFKRSFLNGKSVVLDKNANEFYIEDNDTLNVTNRAEGDVEGWFGSGGDAGIFIWDEPSASWFFLELVEDYRIEWVWMMPIFVKEYSVTARKQPVVSKSAMEAGWVTVTNLHEGRDENGDQEFYVNFDNGSWFHNGCGDGSYTYFNGTTEVTKTGRNNNCGRMFTAAFDEDFTGDVGIAGVSGFDDALMVRDYSPQVADLGTSGELGVGDNLDRNGVVFQGHFVNGLSIYEESNVNVHPYLKLSDGVSETIINDNTGYSRGGASYLIGSAGSYALLNFNPVELHAGLGLGYSVSDLVMNNPSFSEGVTTPRFDAGDAIINTDESYGFIHWLDAEDTFVFYDESVGQTRIYCDGSVLSSGGEFGSTLSGTHPKHGMCNGKDISVASDNLVDFTIAISSPYTLSEGNFDSKIWGNGFAKVKFSNGDSIVYDESGNRMVYFDGAIRTEAAGRQILVNHSGGDTYTFTSSGNGQGVSFEAQLGDHVVLESTCQDDTTGRLNRWTTYQVVVDGNDDLHNGDEVVSASMGSGGDGSSCIRNISVRNGDSVRFRTKNQRNCTAYIDYDLTNGAQCRLTVVVGNG